MVIIPVENLEKPTPLSENPLRSENPNPIIKQNMHRLIEDAEKWQRPAYRAIRSMTLDKN